MLRNVERELKGSLDREGMKAVFHEAAKSSLDRYLMRQAERPWDTEHHALANARHAEYFTLIAEQEKMPHAGSTMEKRLAESGFEDDEIYSIMNIAFAYDESNPAISHRYIAEYLTRAGINPSVRNLQASLRVVAAGYREACIEANRRIGISDTHVDPLPPAMAAMLDLPVVAQFPKSEAAGVGKVDSSQGV